MKHDKLKQRYGRAKRALSGPEQHQLKIARATLRMPDAMANMMNLVSNGPSKEEAREIIRRLTGKAAR
jgi:ABC-type branched-subunit amino acid transport system ATPase component